MTAKHYSATSVSGVTEYSEGMMKGAGGTVTWNSHIRVALL